MFLGMSLVVWLLLGIVAVIVAAVLVAQRMSQYGGARIMFLAPAAFIFSIFVVYPIAGSVWLSLHNVQADRLVCSDGRSIKVAQGDSTCRRVPKMEFIGLLILPVSKSGAQARSARPRKAPQLPH